MNTKVVIGVVAILIIVGLLLFNNNKLSATEVLENADFNEKKSIVEVEFIDRNSDEIFKKINVSEETQQQLIGALKMRN